MRVTLDRLFDKSDRGKLKELLRYGIVGASTTVINIATYQGLLFFLDYKTANIIALIVSKTYGYLANKIIVFHSRTDSVISLMLELVRFVFARGFTAVVDFFGLIIAVDYLGFDRVISKYVLQILVIILNYLLGKFMVFRKSKSEGEMDAENS